MEKVGKNMFVASMYLINRDFQSFQGQHVMGFQNVQI